MKYTYIAGAALALFTLSMSALAQDDIISPLKTYDYQSRKPLFEILKLIRTNLADKIKLLGIEKSLDGVLADPQATLAGKQEACSMLREIGTGVSVPVLAKMLNDEQTNNIARYALERITDPLAGKALRSALSSAKGASLVGVINTVGNRCDALAAPALKKLAVNPDPLISTSAIAALGKTGDSQAAAFLKTLAGKNPAAWQAVVACADRMIALGETKKAEAVYVGLTAEGAPSLPRAAAIRGLIDMKSLRASAIAIAGLKSGDEYVQIASAQIIGLRGDVSLTSKAIEMWPGLPIHAQTVLVTELGERRYVGSGVICLKAMESDNQDLKFAGMKAASQLGLAKAVLPLAQVAGKGGGEGQFAREALMMMPGKEAETEILNLTRTGSPEVRAALLRVLPDRPTANTKAVLMNAALGTENKAAVSALNMLAQIGSIQDVPAIVKILTGSSDNDKRDAAKNAIIGIAGRTENRNDVTALALPAIQSSTGDVRLSLLSSLGEIGGSAALAELTRSLKSDNEELRKTALDALADSWGDTTAVGALLDYAGKSMDKSQKIQAVRGALKLLGQDDKMNADDKVKLVSQAMNLSERVDEKRQALGVLQNIRSSASLELAATLLDNEELFNDAADAVLYLAGPQKKDNRNLRAIKSDAATAALDKIIKLSKDDTRKQQAEKLK